MILSNLLWFSIAGWNPGFLVEPERPPYVLPLRGIQDIDSFIRGHLEHLQRARAIQVMSIDLFEDFLKAYENKNAFPPEDIKRWRQNVEQWKGQLEFIKRHERELELWVQVRKLKPGLETDREAINRITKLIQEEMSWDKAWEAGCIAPMPREVKK